MIRLRLVLWYIFYCLRFGVPPWNFFQLNAPYFNSEKGIFSKLDIDRCIPARWRLSQVPLTDDFVSSFWPVFLKPEWGQNSRGIIRVDSPESLAQAQKQTAGAAVNYIVQEAAAGRREFEVFYIRSPDNEGDYAVLSVTEVTNSCVERYPVNGIHNPCTSYRDCTDEFVDGGLGRLWNFFKDICAYRIARVSLRGDSLEDVSAGNFTIIEINIFLPMPLILLDNTVSRARKINFVKRSMRYAALLSGKLPRAGRRQSIFFRKLLAHYRPTRSGRGGKRCNT
jgi:hypothetical protein